MKQLTFPEITKAFLLTSFSALFAVAAAPAQAVVLDFESLAVINNLVKNVGTTYTEDGFTISQFGVQFGDPLAVFGTQESRYPGSTALFNNSIGSIRLTQVGGGAFTLSSIDLTSLNGDYSVPVTFTGTKADTTTVSQTFTTDTLLSTLETFNFTNFTNLVSVDWGQVDPYHQFDNINVSAAAATAVPEPFTVLGTLFGAGSGVALKRKLSKAQAGKQDIG